MSCMVYPLRPRYSLGSCGLWQLLLLRDSAARVHYLERPEGRALDDHIALLNSLNKSLQERKKKIPNPYHDFQAIIPNDLFSFIPKILLPWSLSHPLGSTMRTDLYLLTC